MFADRRPNRTTVAELLRARADDDAPGLAFEGRSWRWSEVVAESERRARVAGELSSSGPPHIGVLLENVPDYLFWLGGAALAGATVVGINPTRRGEGLARDIRHTDCVAIVTDDAGLALLDGLDTGVPPTRVLHTGSDLSPPSDEALPDVDPDALLLLLFTSGTTGAPKAVRCTQGRLAAIAARAAAAYDFRRDDVCYCPMPLFHGNAIMALWAPALAVGAEVVLTRRFSASRFVSEARQARATRFTYVGKALAYVLATDRRPDDADNDLRIGFGTEASAADRAAFEARFGCRLVEGYGSSEGGIAIQVGADTPPGSLGRATAGDDVAVCDPATGEECEPARFDDGGRLLNAGAAIGEIVRRGAANAFEGYYANQEADAERVRQGWYWSGDLGYRDVAGFFYFAGRGGDWLRVDSENFAAGPVERILERHPDIAAAAVYPVPDPRTGDRVMAALEMRPGAEFAPAAIQAWLAGQPDLGTKWAPTLIRVVQSMPLTATGKITKSGLRAEAWECDDPVYGAEGRDEGWRLLDDDARRRLAEDLERHGRSQLLGAGRSRRPDAGVI